MADQILRIRGRRFKWIPFWKHTVFLTFSEEVTWQEVDWIAQGMAKDGFEVLVYKPE